MLILFASKLNFLSSLTFSKLNINNLITTISVLQCDVMSYGVTHIKEPQICFYLKISNKKKTVEYCNRGDTNITQLKMV